MNNENNTEAYISYSANKIGLSVPAYVRYVWFRHDDYTVVTVVSDWLVVY